MSSTYVQFKSLHPKRWNLFETEKQIQAALEAVVAEGLGLLEAYVSNWDEQVKFKTLRRVFQVGYIVNIELMGSMEITTDNEIFYMVEHGVEPHPISPKSEVSPSNPSRPSALATREGYAAKTRPGSWASSAGGHFGGTIYKPGVWHPGYEGRHMMDSLGLILQAELERRVPVAIERGLRIGIVQ